MANKTVVRVARAVTIGEGHLRALELYRSLGDTSRHTAAVTERRHVNITLHPRMECIYHKSIYLPGDRQLCHCNILLYDKLRRS